MDHRSMDQRSFGTRCVHAGEGDHPHGAHATPIYQTSTFIFNSAREAEEAFSGKKQGYRYSRSYPNTPTHLAFVEKMVSLERAEAGQSFASGMAAEAAVALAVLNKGDRILCTDVVYGGTHALFARILPRFGIETDFVDTSNLEEVQEGIDKGARMVFVESPANPTMKITDLEAVSEIAKDAKAVTVVDNTFASPYFQRPLELGADLVVHSCTKYIGGHGDLLGGVAIGRNDLIRDVSRVEALTGGTMGTHDAFLAIRGLKTLHIRMERHAHNALEVAKFLESHPMVEWVLYPGLKSHPQHSLAKKQMSGYSGMLSFGVRGGYEAGIKVMDGARLCSLAVSLGGVDTLIQHPASMTHAVVPRDVRERLGISDDMIRISVGIEDVEDIIRDLDQALGKI